MMKRFLAFIITFLLIFTSSMITSFAEGLNNHATVFEDIIQTSDAGLNLEKIEDITFGSSSPSISPDAIVLPPIVDGDPYGRELILPTDNRIGRIKCGYDTNYDSIID